MTFVLFIEALSLVAERKFGASDSIARIVYFKIVRFGRTSASGNKSANASAPAAAPGSGDSAGQEASPVRAKSRAELLALHRQASGPYQAFTSNGTLLVSVFQHYADAGRGLSLRAFSRLVGDAGLCPDEISTQQVRLLFRAGGGHGEAPLDYAGTLRALAATAQAAFGGAGRAEEGQEALVERLRSPAVRERVFGEAGGARGGGAVAGGLRVWALGGDLAAQVPADARQTGERPRAARKQRVVRPRFLVLDHRFAPGAVAAQARQLPARRQARAARARPRRRRAAHGGGAGGGAAARDGCVRDAVLGPRGAAAARARQGARRARCAPRRQARRGRAGRAQVQALADPVRPRPAQRNPPSATVPPTAPPTILSLSLPPPRCSPRPPHGAAQGSTGRHSA